MLSSLIITGSVIFGVYGIYPYVFVLRRRQLSCLHTRQCCRLCCWQKQAFPCFLRVFRANQRLMSSHLIISCARPSRNPALVSNTPTCCSDMLYPSAFVPCIIISSRGASRLPFYLRSVSFVIGTSFVASRGVSTSSRSESHTFQTRVDAREVHELQHGRRRDYVYLKITMLFVFCKTRHLRWAATVLTVNCLDLRDVFFLSVLGISQPRTAAGGSSASHRHQPTQTSDYTDPLLQQCNRAAGVSRTHGTREKARGVHVYNARAAQMQLYRRNWLKTKVHVHREPSTTIIPDQDTTAAVMKLLGRHVRVLRRRSRRSLPDPQGFAFLSCRIPRIGRSRRNSSSEVIDR